MKTWSLIVFLCLFSFAGRTQGFEESFRSVFAQSIKGLESLKGAQAGTMWVSATPFPDFTTANIFHDEGKELLALELTLYFTEITDAQDALGKWTAAVEKALPTGDYKKNQTYDADVFGYMKTVFEFNSADFAVVRKRPSVNMGIYEYSGSFALKLVLYEPYFKNQYQPRF